MFKRLKRLFGCQGYYLSGKFNCTPCTNSHPADSHYSSPGPPYSAATAAATAARGGNCTWQCDAGYFQQGGTCPRIPNSTCQSDNVTFHVCGCARARLLALAPAALARGGRAGEEGRCYSEPAELNCLVRGNAQAESASRRQRGRRIGGVHVRPLSAHEVLQVARCSQARPRGRGPPGGRACGADGGRRPCAAASCLP